MVQHGHGVEERKGNLNIGGGRGMKVEGFWLLGSQLQVKGEKIR